MLDWKGQTGEVRQEMLEWSGQIRQVLSMKSVWQVGLERSVQRGQIKEELSAKSVRRDEKTYCTAFVKKPGNQLNL